MAHGDADEKRARGRANEDEDERPSVTGARVARGASHPSARERSRAASADKATSARTPSPARPPTVRTSAPAAKSAAAREPANAPATGRPSPLDRALERFVPSYLPNADITRRRLLIGAGGALATVALLGLGACTWYTHRAVSCTVNGTEREVPVGAKPEYLLSKGYATPVNGNLVSIADADGKVTTLEYGTGNPYTLRVNGQDASLDTYRVSPEDDIEFVNGTNRTEDVLKQVTAVPCGIQIPPDEELLSVIGYVAQWGRDGESTVETGAVSGVTVDRGVTTEPQDLIIAHAHVNPTDGRHLIALTFDDGPSLEYTPQYLDILAQYGAKATFFNLGSVLEGGDEYVAMAKRCVDEGHQVASHTYSHTDVTLSGLDEAGRAQEISRTFELVGEATGVPTQVMRPPYGEFRGWQYLQYLANTGDIACSAYWSVDSEDWELPGADGIVASCTKNIDSDNYNGAVILMHDGGGDRSQDVEALPRIIETYQGLGYELVTLDELLASDETFPEWVSAGYVERPEGTVIPDISAYVG